MAYLYRHIRLDKNEVFYVGIGKEKNYGRAYAKINRNKHWINIVSNSLYEVEILAEGLTWEEACIKEMEFIKLYGRKDLKKGTLVNLTDGGEGNTGLLHSKETKEKISKAGKGKKRLPFTLEHREKLSNAAKNREPRVITEEHKQKLSEKSGRARKLQHTVTGKTFKSIREAALLTECCAGTIENHIKKGIYKYI